RRSGERADGIAEALRGGRHPRRGGPAERGPGQEGRGALLLRGPAARADQGRGPPLHRRQGRTRPRPGALRHHPRGPRHVRRRPPRLTPAPAIPYNTESPSPSAPILRVGCSRSLAGWGRAVGGLFSRWEGPMTRWAIAMAITLTAAGAAPAAVQTKEINYESDGVKLKGFLAYDDATADKRPGVLVFPEWWGLNDYAKDRCKQLAGLGYVAFAADLYGEGKVIDTAHPEDAQKMATALRTNV